MHRGSGSNFAILLGMKRMPKKPAEGTQPTDRKKLKLVKELVRSQLDKTVVGGMVTHRCNNF
jgi:hypothetical protein